MKTYYSWTIYLGVPIALLLLFILVISVIFIIITYGICKSKKRIEAQLQQERENSYKVYEEICLSDTDQLNTAAAHEVTENIAYVHMQASCN
jgi:uncharacterized protein YpmB